MADQTRSQETGASNVHTAAAAGNKLYISHTVWMTRAAAQEHILKRSLVLFDGETLGGARLGEMTGGGKRPGFTPPMSIKLTRTVRV